ncbi:hypothetical protein GCM10011607_28820 [Shewanella inventionis]|uniref:Uncharacterized protein n=1 Tax=Shewanella inventionis TaxID=1738770 RepID=A0ABQ1JDT7_9GAMM|nr:hypothetical protein [Shewanella inventionis]GGB66395.1 hypothetical protein GCM10011607_28820 [Shewanella inventionis]
MKIIKAVSLAVLGVVASANAMPNRTELELFDNWKVAYLQPENEYWAYAELTEGYNIALVAGSDVVGPGCRVTNVAVFSDVKTLQRANITARITFGESGENKLEGLLVENRRPWASMYSVVNTSTKYIDEFVDNVYNTNDKAMTLTLHDENEFVAKDVLDMSGVRSAYIRMIERCQLGSQRRIKSTYGFK